MLTIVHGLLHRHSHWRDIKMSELSELYLSNTLKTLAISLISIFIPVYLYDLGHSVSTILAFFIVFFGVRPFVDVTAGYFVARFGPKHVMRASYMTTLISLAMLVTLPEVGWPLWSVAVVQTIGWSYYWLAYHTDFSKVKHTKTEGKELGTMTILSRLVSVLGPLAGGALALVTSIQFVFLLAVAVMFIATVPLMMTPEPIKTHQKFSFAKMPWRTVWRDFLVQDGITFDQISVTLFWPLFVALAVFEFDDAIYAKIGFVTSISLIIGVLMIKAMGQLIDSRRGGDLLRYSVMSLALLHAVRPFATTPLSVILINTVSEPPYNGARLSLIKGIYDRADSLGDLRIPYITAGQMSVAFTRTIYITTVWVVAQYFDEIETLQLAMLIAALATPLVLLQKFPALKSAK